MGTLISASQVFSPPFHPPSLYILKCVHVSEQFVDFSKAHIEDLFLFYYHHFFFLPDINPKCSGSTQWCSLLFRQY